MAIPDEKLKMIAKTFEMHLGKAAFAGMKKNRDKINQVFLYLQQFHINCPIKIRFW